MTDIARKKLECGGSRKHTAFHRFAPESRAAFMTCTASSLGIGPHCLVKPGNRQQNSSCKYRILTHHAKGNGSRLYAIDVER